MPDLPHVQGYRKQTDLKKEEGKYSPKIIYDQNYENQQQEEIHLTLNGRTTEEAEMFFYLGSVVTKKVGTEQDKKNCIGKALIIIHPTTSNMER